MNIPTWISLPLCLVLPWLTGFMWYVAGKCSERRRLAAQTPPRMSLDVKVMFAGSPDEHPDLSAKITEAIREALKSAPQGGDA